MRRKTMLTSGNGQARITVTINATTKKLSRDEVETLMDEATRGVMLTLERVAYAQTPINRIKVR